MANFKKEDKASIIARLEVLEKWKEEVEAYRSKWNAPPLTPITDGPNSATAIAYTPTASPVIPTGAVPEVKHKCQTNTCESMETKEYQGKDRKMWLCDSHKF